MTAAEDAARSVRPESTDDDLAEVFAAGAWTALVEPGDAHAGALVQSFGAAAALDALRRGTPPTPVLRDAFARWTPRLDEAVLLRAFRNAAALGIRLVLPGDPDWPRGLDDLGAHAPLALWAHAPAGPLPALGRSVAIVGAREATPYGVRVTEELACGLADRGFAIVSGAATGIDGVAHRSALASQGLTVAVLAGGLDRLYPSEHTQLLHRIAADGVVLSEMPCGARPMKERFLKRNRLIAAMTRTTVVVEAALRSGARNTAGHAAELGRPLGVVPGSVFSALSAGCHLLLREYDAVLVRDAADVAELASDPDAAVTLSGLERLAETGDPNERRMLEVLARRPRSATDLAARAGLGVADATAALGMLTLLGTVRQSDAGWAKV